MPRWLEDTTKGIALYIIAVGGWFLMWTLLFTLIDVVR